MQPNGYQPFITPAMPGKQKNRLIIPFILMVILFIGVFGFAMWAYGSAIDYKTNTDKKIATASEVARLQAATEKDKEFAETSKNPLKSYKGSETYGGLYLEYPRVWSAYIDETASNDLINGYFYPDFVPAIQETTSFALRIKVVNRTYKDVVAEFEGATKTGKIKVSPFHAVKVPSVLGARVEGEIDSGQKDTMIVIPIRDKTIQVWTESDTYLKDFDTYVVPSLSFSP